MVVFIYDDKGNKIKSFKSFTVDEDMILRNYPIGYNIKGKYD